MHFVYNKSAYLCRKKIILVFTLVYFSKLPSQRGSSAFRPSKWWKIWLKWSLCVCEREREWEREGINEPLIYSSSLGTAPPCSMFTPSLLSLPIIMDTVFLREYQTKPYSHCSTESALNGSVQLTAIKQLIKTGHTTAWVTQMQLHGSWSQRDVVWDSWLCLFDI